MGRVAAVLRESNPFADFVRAFAPIAMQGMDERKKQEENAALGQMYLEAMRGPADAAVAPYQANAIQSQDDAYRKQVVAESSAMTDAAIANNPALTQRIQGQTAPVTPEQAPALQQQFQQTNQQALGQANNQAQSAEQMLAMAKEKYGTAMFDRLAPIVQSGKVPAQAMIGIIERQIAQAEKQAVKAATQNAVKILSDKNADPAQKQGVLAQLMIDNPQAARGMAEAFGLKPNTSNYPTIERPDGVYQILPDGTARKVTGAPGKPDKPEKTPAGTWLLQKNPDGSQTRINTITGQTMQVSPPSDVLIPTPFGPMKNTDLLAKIEQFRPKETVTEDDYGKKITKREGNADLYNQLTNSLKDWQSKQNPANPNQPTADQSDLQMPLILEGISAIGEDAMRKKIAAKYGDKVAEEWIVRSRNWSR